MIALPGTEVRLGGKRHDATHIIVGEVVYAHPPKPLHLGDNVFYGG